MAVVLVLTAILVVPGCVSFLVASLQNWRWTVVAVTISTLLIASYICLAVIDAEWASRCWACETGGHDDTRRTGLWMLIVYYGVALVADVMIVSSAAWLGSRLRQPA